MVYICTRETLRYTNTAPGVERHTAYVRCRDPGGCRDRGLDTRVAKPRDVLVYGVRFTTTGLSGEEHMRSRLQNSESFRLRHRQIIHPPVSTRAHFLTFYIVYAILFTEVF